MQKPTKSLTTSFCQSLSFKGRFSLLCFDEIEDLPIEGAIKEFQNLEAILISSTKGPTFEVLWLNHVLHGMNLEFIKPQSLGSLLMKSSQSNVDLRSPSS